MAGFVKIYQTILDSSVWGEAHATRLVWITLLAMADFNGRVEASVGGLARRAQVSESECRSALLVLSSPDPDDKSKVDEGRRIREVERGWHINNHGYYRDLRTESQIKTAERVKRHRAKNVTGNDVTQRNAAKRSVRTDPDPDPDRSLSAAAPPEKKETVRKRGISEPIPEDFAPDTDGRLLAKNKGLNVPTCVAEFVAHAKANGLTKVDWQAAFVLWVMRAPDPKERVVSPVRFVERDADQHAINSAIEGVCSGAYGQSAQRKAKALSGPELGVFALQAENAWRGQRRAAAE